jgi:hypothetical protein
MMIASARAGTLYNMVMSRGMQGSDTEALNQGTPDFNGSGSNTPRGAFARLAYLNKLYVTGGTVNGSDEPKFYREASEILGNEAERGCFDDNAWRSRQNVLIRKLTLNINMRSMLLAGRVIITD